jgi:hypothetical protein
MLCFQAELRLPKDKMDVNVQINTLSGKVSVLTSIAVTVMIGVLVAENEN